MVVIAFVLAAYTPVFLPLHEVGHFVLHWLTGNPAIMRWTVTEITGYSWLGTLGGPLADAVLPTILVSIFAKRDRRRVANFFLGLFIGRNFATLTLGFKEGADFANILARHGAGGVVLAVTVYGAVVLCSILLIAYSLTTMKERLTQKEKRRKLEIVGRRAA